MPLYKKALELADPAHHMVPIYHAQLAGVLAAWGRHDEAQGHYQMAVSLELAQSGDEFALGGVLARYFLAEHFLARGDANAALEAVERSLKDGAPREYLLRYVRALSLHALGEQEKARYEADMALNCAPSESMRQQLFGLFNESFGHEAGQA